MYYRLKDNFILRGYDKLPYVLINLNNGYADFMNADTMNAIDLCDGSIDLSLPFIPAKTLEVIAKIKKAGVIEPCEAGHQQFPENHCGLKALRQ